MADAKIAALKFAQCVLEWVERLAVAFGEGGSGHFVASAWNNLAEIRTLIESVCTWAHRMLNVRISERTSVHDTISSYQKKFTQAIDRFGVIANIHIAIGQDVINRNLDILNSGQDRLQHRLDVIGDGLAELVSKPQIPDASYRFQNKVPCNPSTRKQVIGDIMEWICDISEGSPSFIWLSGDPGVGKSAVTASIAKECIHRNILWAQYFINRNDAATIDPLLYFPSIVQQMSQRNPAVGYAFQDIAQEHRDLLKYDMSLQGTELFLKAARIVSETSPREPIVIVIDALDETDLKRLRTTAEEFSRILADVPYNVKVFISSRVEDVIRDNFAHHKRARNMYLSATNSVGDVTQFLQEEIHKIMGEFQIQWAEWGEERMKMLCDQASGLFIWAVTAVEYIRAEIEDSGRECLGVVLNELNEKGMNNINVLYLSILRRTYRRETDPWSFQRFRRIVGAILAQQTPLSITDLEQLLDLRSPRNGAPVDIEHFVRRLRTLLVAGVGKINGRTFPRVHKSFADFITSPKAEEFRVDMAESNGELGLQSIQRLLRLWDGEMPTQLRYAASHWSTHLTRIVGMARQEEKDDTVSVHDSEDTDLVQSSEEPGHASSALTISSKNNQEVLGGKLFGVSISSDSKHIAYARGLYVVLEDTEGGKFTLGGHTDDVRLASFSPDGKYIASASSDTTIRIWNVDTRELVRGPLMGHSRTVHSATFSPQGRQIASNSSDETIRVWDAQTGEMTLVLSGHTADINLAVFSPDGARIVSACDDRTARIWDANTGEVLHVLTGHSTWIPSAFFSPDGRQILSCSEEGTFIVWDLLTEAILPNGCSDEASLALTPLGSSSSVIIPKLDTAHQHNPASISYSFGVPPRGMVGGASNMWVYIDLSRGFVMSTYLGQLTMQYLYGIEKFFPTNNVENASNHETAESGDNR